MKYIIASLFLLASLAACTQTVVVNDFDSCVEAGNPVMESYPRQCTGPDGTTYTESLDASEFTLCTPEELAGDICTFLWDPVCGDDGETYSNACVGCSSGNIDGYTAGACEEVIGGDTDSHGCLIGAGYAYSEDVGACIRDWELGVAERDAAAEAVASQSGDAYTVIEVVPGDCDDCYIVSLRRHSDDSRFVVDVGTSSDNSMCTQELLDAEICTQEYNPVCGDDGMTYSNPCVACSSGAITSYDAGACDEEAEMTSCTPDQLAAEICTLEYAPVCGDDGVTYGNACSGCSSGNIESYSAGECPT